MIGPSVQLAEVAGYLTDRLLTSCGDTFVLFDIFSGSSATSLPSFAALYKWVQGNKDRKAYIKRINEMIPKVDYLKEYLNSQTGSKDKIFFDNQKDYISATFNFDKGCINKDTKFCDFINKSILNNGKDKIDLTIADPPHIFALPFLFRKGDKNGCFAKVISKKTGVFVVYYAHKEQVRLCEYIRNKLKTYFKHLWRVTIAGEEMAVCYNDNKLLPENLSEGFNDIAECYYGENSDVVTWQQES